MFKKILIANRGEIACRIIRTARRLGIATVAVHSEADADALHVRMADEAVAIGPAPSTQSYLAIDRVVAAARSTGAEAVHPGYGFLSENAHFAEALAAAGLVFIGPDPAAMAALGDKIAAKRLARTHGVSTVPGHAEAIADETEAAAVARDIGFPVILKASAGGGGKGMRVARSAEEAREGFRSASSEARASFGDDRIFIEKYVEEPRHIEIQVLGDRHGHVVHLGERECSIQRRHQKVIEEAPSPFLDAAMRRQMGEQAVTLARSVGYSSAGTVEFIVGRDRRFYFLEMNTRLQVEHPVTEAVTGLDLVELMIRIAAGERLPFAQADIRLAGWAIEARVYAEDPGRGFLPSIGRLTRFRPPPEGEGLRIDTGVFEGGEIAMHYDPMIAKVIASGADRPTAAARLGRALDAFQIRGVQHNIAFLAALIGHPRFAEGRLSTSFIAEAFGTSFTGVDLAPEAADRLIALAVLLQARSAERERRVGSDRPALRPPAAASWTACAGGRSRQAAIRRADQAAEIELDGVAHQIEGAWNPGDTLFLGRIDGQDAAVQIEPRIGGFRLTQGGATLDIRVLRPRAAELAARMPVKAPPDLSRFLLSPMPGLLVSLAVADGQPVRAGEALAVVEAMKMENILRAERDGVVARLHARAGDSLSVDQKILEFE